MVNDTFSAICDLVSCFNRHGARYLIGGSVSSSLNGVFRTTNDIDVLVEKPLGELLGLLVDLRDKFLVDQKALVESHKQLKSYNIFHEESALKIYLFPAHSRFHQEQLNRAILVSPPSAHCSFKISTAEDIIIQKLLWQKNWPSERQISDIIGVINLNRKSLDLIFPRFC